MADCKIVVCVPAVLNCGPAVPGAASLVCLLNVAPNGFHALSLCRIPCQQCVQKVNHPFIPNRTPANSSEF